MEFSSFREAVRQRPAMYFGSTGPTGAEQMVWELVGNAIDQFAAGAATTVRVRLGKRQVTVTDDGAGLPFDEPAVGQAGSRAEEFLTIPHHTASAAGHAPHIHLVTVGAGLAPVVAASDRFEVLSWRGGKRYRLTTEKGFLPSACRKSGHQGKPVGPPEVIEEGRGRGTRVTLRFDRDIMPADPRPEVVRHRLFTAAHLFPGLRVCVGRETFHAPRGLADLALLMDFSSEPARIPPPPFSTTLETAGMRVQAAAWGRVRGKKSQTIWHTWVNGANTAEGGSHQHGFRQALHRAGWQPACAFLHVIMLEPRFAGPTTRKIARPDIVQPLAQALLPEIERYLHATGTNGKGGS